MANSRPKPAIRGRVVIDKSENRTVTEMHNESDSSRTYFNDTLMRPQRMSLIRDKGVISSQRLCNACRGITIESLSQAIPFEHSSSYSVVNQRQDICPLCDMIAAGLGWHPAFSLDGMASGPVLLSLVYDPAGGGKPGSVFMDVTCYSGPSSDPHSFKNELRFPLLTREGEHFQSLS